MLKQNNYYSSLNFTVESLFYLALQGWYVIDYTKVRNQIFATDILQNTHSACLLCLQHCQKESFLHLVS